MVNHDFDNDYDMLLWAFSTLLDRFEKADKLFAAQCIWWLASIIQLSEILSYYRQYTIFPSEYLRECIVTPLPATSQRNIKPEDEIAEISITSAEDNNWTISQEGPTLLLGFEQSTKHKKSVLSSTRSDKILKHDRSNEMRQSKRSYSDKALKESLGPITKFQRKQIRKNIKDDIHK